MSFFVYFSYSCFIHFQWHVNKNMNTERKLQFINQYVPVSVGSKKNRKRVKLLNRKASIVLDCNDSNSLLLNLLFIISMYLQWEIYFMCTVCFLYRYIVYVWFKNFISNFMVIFIGCTPLFISSGCSLPVFYFQYLCTWSILCCCC